MDNMNDSLFFDIYKELFKTHNIRLKKLNRKQSNEFSDMIFKLTNNISYGVRWYKNSNMAIYGRIKNKRVPEEDQELDHESAIKSFEILKNPTAENIVDAIAQDYKQYLKSGGILKKIVSKIIKEQYHI